MYNCTELIQLDSNDLKFWKFRKKNLNSFLSSFICRCVVFCSVPLLCPSAAQHSAFPPHLPCISLVSPAPVLFSAFFSARHCHLCLSAALSHLHLVPSLAHIFFYVLVASSALLMSDPVPVGLFWTGVPRRICWPAVSCHPLPSSAPGVTCMYN